MIWRGGRTKTGSKRWEVRERQGEERFERAFEEGRFEGELLGRKRSVSQSAALVFFPWALELFTFELASPCLFASANRLYPPVAVRKRW